MNKRRRRFFESLEARIVLDGAGLGMPPDGMGDAYIIAFTDQVANPNAVAKALLAAHGGQIGHVYEHAIKGFSAQLPEAAVQALQRNPNVLRIEPDLEMKAFVQVTPMGIDRIDVDRNPVANIDGQHVEIDVDIAIIDSGIDGSHPDLNVVGGYNATNGPSSNWNDGFGHGTHVAGTAAAMDNDFGVVGVAPGARLWAVKVLGNNGSGRLSDIIEGIDWVTANSDTIEVANMSLGGRGASQTYHQAIKNSVASGVVYVVAAGNEYRDILGSDFQFGTNDDTIPAVYPEVATISAFADTDGMPGGTGPQSNFADSFRNYSDDEFADFSNFSNSDASNNSWYASNNVVDNPDGLGIDLVLPGVDIYSTYKGGGYANNTGTSMAAPHASGLAALYIAAHGRAQDAAGVYAIRQALIDGGKDWTGPEGMAYPPLGDSPDKHVEHVGWGGPAESLTDISITSIIAPTSIVVGDTVQVEVIVQNSGNQAVTSHIEVSLGESPDGTSFATQTILGGLAAGDLNTLTFSWQTTGSSLGAHTLTVTHNLTDDVSSNDTRSVFTFIETAITDLAITAIDANSAVSQGDVVAVDVTIQNVGNQDISGDAVVGLSESPNTTVFGSQTIIGGLAAGQSTTLRFLWDTTTASLGDHMLTAGHDFSDDQATNNSRSLTVHVTEASSLGVSSITPNSVQLGQSVDVIIIGTGFELGATVTMLNGEGKQPAVSNIIVVDSSTITAAISTRSGGPPRDRFWDVVIVNPGGESASLVDGFLVTAFQGSGSAGNSVVVPPVNILNQPQAQTVVEGSILSDLDLDLAANQFELSHQLASQVARTPQRLRLNALLLVPEDGPDEQELRVSRTDVDAKYQWETAVDELLRNRLSDWA